MPLKPSTQARVDRSTDLAGPVTYFLDGPCVDRHQKPEHRCEAEHTHFHEQLQIVVVRLIDEEIGVEGAELRIHDGKSSQAPAQHGLLQEHLKAIAVDVMADVAG